MPASPIRYKRLLQELPKHKTAQSALLASGFSKNTARTQAKSVLRSAVRNQAKELLQSSKTDTLTSKQLMNEILGITSNDLFNRLKWLALENDRDAGTALKILAPLVREHGVILSADDDQKTSNAPVLNLSFGSVSIAENVARNIEPVLDNEVIDMSNPNDGSTKP